MLTTSATSILKTHIWLWSLGIKLGSHSHFLAASGSLKPVGPNSWRLNDAITVTVKAPALLRGQDQKAELIVPLGQPQKLELRYEW